jgi:hypothetical protein
LLRFRSCFDPGSLAGLFHLVGLDFFNRRRSFSVFGICVVFGIRLKFI